MSSFLRRFRAVLGQREAPSAPSTDALQIRPMAYRDLGAVMAVENASFAAPWRMSSYARAVGERGHSFFVAEMDGGLVGYSGLWAEGDRAHIAKVAVHEDYRRRGIGSTLLEHLIDHSLRLGLTRMYLEVRRSNVAAQQMYRRFGFQFERVQPGAYPDDGEDAFIFVLARLLDARRIRRPT
jgi:ribosomal-protein-alanine N-acetyltransferase